MTMAFTICIVYRKKSIQTTTCIEHIAYAILLLRRLKKTKIMFRKLVSGLPFSPALVGTLGFYANRLKQEEMTRRLGLIVTAFALVLQSFAVFAPPEAANAASGNDLIYGGVTSLDQVLRVYDDPAKDYKKILTYNGITRAELAAAKSATINSQEFGKGDGAWTSWGRYSKFSAAQGEVKHNINGTIVYSRPLWRFDTTSWTTVHGSTYNVFKGYSQKLGVFVIMQDCGNLAARKLPTPPPPPPAPTAACSNLDAIKISAERYRFRVTTTVSGGATISNYTILVKNQNGTIVKTISQPSTSTTLDLATQYTFSPGTYTATATVTTSTGAKTSAGCSESFTIPQPPTPTHPGVSVDKTVDGVEQKTVAIGQEFTYTIVVKNTGDVSLSNVALTDNQPTGVTFTSASAGNIANGKWTHTLASLAVGQSASFTLKAKAPTYVAGLIKNTVCVETPTVTSGNPDDCDDAVIELPTPQIQVCELATFKIITIKQTDFNTTLHSKDPNDCKRIQVCDLTSDTVITIREVDFNSTKHSKKLDDCANMQVCDLKIGEVTTIPRNNFDPSKHSKDTLDCQTSVVLAKTATNLTQQQAATTVIAKGGDRIQYVLSATNAGKVNATVDFKENMTDTLEYGVLNDNGGSASVTENGATYLSWGKILLKPGEKVTRTITVKVHDVIPATARGTSEPGSYDCIMTNTFGNSLSISVNCTAPKVLEAAIEQLPSTGPGENMLFAGVLGSVVTFFYARSRQLNKEVRLIRKDFNAGTL